MTRTFEELNPVWSKILKKLGVRGTWAYDELSKREQKFIASFAFDEDEHIPAIAQHRYCIVGEGRKHIPYDMATDIFNYKDNPDFCETCVKLSIVLMDVENDDILQGNIEAYVKHMNKAHPEEKK